jgi:hypothetical protein
MTTDLAKLYAKVKQRAERDRGTPWEELGKAARARAKEIMFAQTLAATRRFAAAERAWLGERDRVLEPVAPEFAEALRSGDFVCNYKTINNLNTGHDPEVGWIYLVKTPTRPDQVKIGYTTMELRRRLLRIRRLHEPDAELHWARWVKYPARLEGFLHSELREVRVAGNVTGDSIEWFRAEASSVEMMVHHLLQPKSEYWSDKILYSHDPEGVSIEQ